MRVVVAHPVHQHAYETAAAAQRAHALERFVTGIFRTGRGLTDPRLVQRLPAFARPAVTSNLERRSHPGIDPARVTSLAAPDALSVVAARTPFVAGTDHQGRMMRTFDARVARRLARWPSDVVHAYEGAALQTLRSARRTGRLAVLDVPSPHELYASVASAEGETGLHFPTGRIRAERGQADMLLAPSEGVAACLEADGVSRDRIAIVPYAADPASFAQADPGSDGPLRAVFVGRLTARKGIRYLLEAWRRLALPGAALTLVGAAGSPELARDLPPGVAWVGHRSRREVARLLSAAHLFVFPSLAEGSALVTYEAMAAGLPSIVTRESGSVVRDGSDGLLVRARDATELAERIEALAADPSLRARMGSSARAYVESGFTWRHYGDRVVSVWTERLR